MLKYLVIDQALADIYLRSRVSVCRTSHKPKTLNHASLSPKCKSSFSRYAEALLNCFRTQYYRVLNIKKLKLRNALYCFIVLK